MRRPLEITLEGAVDLHVHPAPCLFARPHDDAEVAQMCAAAGMKAILLKNHYECTVSRAYHTARQVPGIHTFGGIVLNRYVGGLNPYAVEWALRMGAKQVWMPNIDAAAHAAVYGAPGTYQRKGHTSSLKPVEGSGRMISGEGIRITEHGELKDATKEIVQLIVQHDAILGTGHLDKAEIFQLVEFANREGCRKIVITHPYYSPPSFTLEELEPLVHRGAWLECCAVMAFPPLLQTTIAREVELIRRYGADRCIIVSDAGAVPFPAPVESLRAYAQWLYDAGISKENLRQMMVENPSRLLNL
jgi:hypothetical protein